MFCLHLCLFPLSHPCPPLKGEGGLRCFASVSVCFRFRILVRPSKGRGIKMFYLRLCLFSLSYPCPPLKGEGDKMFCLRLCLFPLSHPCPSLKGEGDKMFCLHLCLFPLSHPCPPLKGEGGLRCFASVSVCFRFLLMRTASTKNRKNQSTRKLLI